MGIKYYELKVKKLVNFNNQAYAILEDVNSIAEGLRKEFSDGISVKLDASEFGLFQSEFTTFQNNVVKLGTAAGKDVGTSVGNVVEVGADGKISSSIIPTVSVSENLGKFESWSAAAGGVSHTPEINDIVSIKDEGKGTYSIYICVDPSATTLKDKFVLLNPGEGAVSLTQYLLHTGDTDIHITADERATWNAKIGEIIAGDNVSVTTNDDGSVTISGTAEYVLPTATAEVKGGVKVGETVNVDGEGVLNINKADAENLGGIKLGFGLQKNGEDGVVDAVAKTTAPISVTKDIGYLKMGSTISEGSTLTDILTSLLTTYITPKINTLTLTEAGPKEVGETATISKLEYKFDDNYTVYGKETVLKSGTVKFFNGGTTGTDITSDGEFTGNTGVPPKSASLTLSNDNKITLNPPASGATGSRTFAVSCGYIKEDGSDGVVSKTATISWQLAYFKGISTADGMPYEVDENGAKLLVRTNGTRVLNPSIGTKVSTMTANYGHKMVWIAYPKSVRPASQKVTSIIALDSMNAQVKDAFTYEEIKVSLADGTVLDYTLCYLKPDGGFTQQARYDITL